MEIVAVLRVLWRRRLLLAIGFVAAVALGMKLGRSPLPPSGFAKTRVVFDTPESQLVTGAPNGADSLPWRATLAAMLLGSDSARLDMSRALGIPAGQLDVTDLELTAPSVPASLPRAATTAADVLTAPYSLTVHTDDTLPVVGIEAAAPDRVAATRLAAAAVRVLQAGASSRDTREIQGLSVQPVGPIESRELPGASGRKKMAIVFVGVFGMWTVALLAGPLLRGIALTTRETQAAAS
jgi:hypothetical protein